MRIDEADFDVLLQRLQGNPLDGLGTEALAVRAPEAFFVPPRFTVMEDVPESPIILLSARGAAGKTTVANELSRTLGAPVWRLQDDSGVSKASVHSTLVQHLNTVNPLSALDALDSPLLIVDSLDEARTRVSATSWTEFVEALLDASRHGLRLLLLGRVRTLEDLWVTLVDADSQPAWYEVSHFDTAGQVSYVNHRARIRDSRTDISTTSYQEARDAILSALRAATLEAEAERFVGYPPVLDAVAQRLVDNPNYIATANDFSNLHGASRSSVLKRIIEDLLMREQTKLGPVARDLSLDPAMVYTPQEQAAWLLHDLESAPKPLVLQECTLQQQHEYYEHVAIFREDHPFRNASSWASPVFQAYIISEEFDRAPGASILRAGRASGLLFELICGDETEELLLDETQFASLHASLLTGQWQSADASAFIGSDGDRFQGQFETSTEGHVRAVPFLLSSSSAQTISLRGPLTNLTVDVDRGVLVPADGADVLLGPDLHLNGEIVTIEGSRAVFARRDEEQGATDVDIQAHSQLSLPPTIVAPVPRKGIVEVIPPAGVHLAYPWSEYEEQAPAAFPGIDDRAVRFLDKLMNLTRVHGHKGDRAVFIKKLEGRQPLPTPQFRAALECLISHGVIYVENELVYVSHSWEVHRYNGKSVPGQRSLDDVMDAWRPVLQDITETFSS